MRPGEEPIRFAQDPSLIFAPAAIAALERGGARPPRLVQRVFGFLGPNGALPIHLTEYARERQLYHADPTFTRISRHAAASLRPVLLPRLGAGAAGRRPRPPGRRADRPPCRRADRDRRNVGARARCARRLSEAVLRRPAGALGARRRRARGLARRCSSASPVTSQQFQRPLDGARHRRALAADARWPDEPWGTARCSGAPSGTCSTSSGSSSGRSAGTGSRRCCRAASRSTSCRRWCASTSASNSTGTCG